MSFPANFRIIGLVGDLWEPAVAAAAGLVVAWITGRRAARWARARCDQALEAAGALPSPAEPKLTLVAGSGPDPAGRGPARLPRVVQQALDGG